MSAPEPSNPYAPPPQMPLIPDEEGMVNDASRGERFGAAFIDGLIQLAILIPIQWRAGAFAGLMHGARQPFGSKVMWALVAYALYCVVNTYTLNANGQTIGKKLVGIRVVKLDGSKPDLVNLLLLRYGSLVAFGLIPVIGVLGNFIDPLFIFGERKRCLHDLVADTRVVVV